MDIRAMIIKSGLVRFEEIATLDPAVKQGKKGVE